MSKDDRKAAFLLLQLAEQGRPIEVAAQYMASWWLGTEQTAEEAAGFHHEIHEIYAGVLHLINNPGLIWEGLLPGPAGSPPEFEIKEITEPTRVGITIMKIGPDGWLLWDAVNGEMFKSPLNFYKNASHPESDQLSAGMTIEVMESDTTTLLKTEAAEYMESLK